MPCPPRPRGSEKNKSPDEEFAEAIKVSLSQLEYTLLASYRRAADLLELRRPELDEKPLQVFSSASVAPALDQESSAPAPDQDQNPGHIVVIRNSVANVLDVRCSNCGNVFMADSVFCRVCGHRRVQEDVGEGEWEEEPEFDATLVHDVPSRWLDLAYKTLHHDEAGGFVKQQVYRYKIELRDEWKKQTEEEKHLPNPHALEFMMVRPELEVVTALKAGDVLKDNTCLQPWVLPPHSYFRLFWGIAGLLALVWDIITIPLLACDLGQLMYPIIDLLGYVVFAYWVLDMPLNFLVGIDSGSGVIEMRPAKIARVYCTTWLLPDMFLICVDVVIYTLDWLLGTTLPDDSKPGSLSVEDAFRLVRMLRLLRFLRLLRLAKSSQIYEAMESRLRSEHSRVFAKIAVLSCQILLINHYCACGWYFIATTVKGDAEIDVETWIDFYGPFSLSEAYLSSMHWAFTQFSPATQNIAPRNEAERIYAICVVFYAFLAFSSFVSAVTNAVNELKRINFESSKMQAQVRQFFAEKKISSDLWMQIQSFCKSRGLQREAQSKEQDIRMFMEIPETLRIRLHQEQFMPVLKEAQFLKGLRSDDLTHLSLLKICHLAMLENTIEPRSDVFVDGSVAKHCYFSRTGSMCYYSIYLPEPKPMLGGHDWISEITVFANWHHRGQLTTETSCSFVLIDCCKLCQVIRKGRGPLYEYLSLVAMLIVSEIEDETDSQHRITDFGLPVDEGSLGRRAQAYADMKRKKTGVSAQLSI